jgi:hypothetical protein
VVAPTTCTETTATFVRKPIIIILFYLDDELNDFDKRLKNNKTDGFFN